MPRHFDRTPVLQILVLLLLHPSFPCVAGEDSDLDILIQGGRVVDGTGAPWFRADVGVRNGRIAAVGRLQGFAARRTIDAGGLIVAPGFVDLMGQTALPMLKDPGAGLNLLTQGITTINAGEGDSAAPLGRAEGSAAGWQTFSELFDHLERTGLPLNVVHTVGHTQVRRLVLGAEARPASPEELEEMKALVREGMEAGAIGLSTALTYPPAVFASEEEITALATVAGEYGGRYFTHVRSEGSRLLEAVEEALRIGRKAVTPVHIFHLKAAGQENWHQMDSVLARIRASRASGLEVGADVYPYVRSGISLRAFLHPRHSAKGLRDLLSRLADATARADMRREMEADGSWENWYSLSGSDWDHVLLGEIADPEYAGLSGRSLGDAAQVLDRDPWDVFFALARLGTFAMPLTMSEANKEKVVVRDFVCFSTDVGPVWGTRASSHPRACGSFPRVLARYVREQGLLSLEEALHRMTAVAANEILAYDRGKLAPGLPADIVVFDASRIRDVATYEKPDALSEGVEYVLVNGEVVLEEGKYTGELPGKILKGPGCRSSKATPAAGVTRPRVESGR